MNNVSVCIKKNQSDLIKQVLYMISCVCMSEHTTQYSLYNIRQDSDCSGSN